MWQEDADRITKICALLSDDNCSQLCFIHFSFLLLSASCCEGRKRGRERKIDTFAKWTLNLPTLLFKTSPLVLSGFGPMKLVLSWNLSKQPCCLRLNGSQERIEHICTDWPSSVFFSSSLRLYKHSLFLPHTVFVSLVISSSLFCLSQFFPELWELLEPHTDTQASLQLVKKPLVKGVCGSGECPIVSRWLNCCGPLWRGSPLASVNYKWNVLHTYCKHMGRTPCASFSNVNEWTHITK